MYIHILYIYIYIILYSHIIQLYLSSTRLVYGYLLSMIHYDTDVSKWFTVMYMVNLCTISIALTLENNMFTHLLKHDILYRYYLGLKLVLC